MRSGAIVFLMLLGFLATAIPFSSAMSSALTEPAIQTAQVPGPPPPDCGIFDICKGKPAA